MAKTFTEFASYTLGSHPTAVCARCDKRYHEEPRRLCPHCEQEYSQRYRPYFSEGHIRQILNLEHQITEYKELVTRYENLCLEATNALRFRRIRTGPEHSNSYHALDHEVRLLTGGRDWKPSTVFTNQVVRGYYEKAETADESFNLKKHLDAIWEEAHSNKWFSSVKSFWDHLKGAKNG